MTHRALYLHDLRQIRRLIYAHNRLISVARNMHLPIR